MNKSTLSQYGWVIITIIIIALLLGFTGPYCNFLVGSNTGTVSEFGGLMGESLGYRSATLYANGTMAVEGLFDDKIVIDFAKPMKVDILANDYIPAGGSLNAIGKELPDDIELDTKAYSESQLTDAVTENLIIGSGTVSVVGDQILYTPTAAILGESDVFYYEYKTTTGKYYYSTVTIVQGSSVYYEETFAHPMNREGFNPLNHISGENSVCTCMNDPDDVYGYDECYNTSSNFSNGSAYESSFNSSDTKADTLEFTFTGTGVDIIGTCTNMTGVMIVRVDNSEGKMIKAYITDTYYNGEFGDYHQAPLVCFRSTYGTYTIQVSFGYLSFAGALKNYSGSEAKPTFKGYVDGFRVYDDTHANSEYYAEGEKKPTYYNVITELMTGGKFEDLGTNLPDIGYIEGTLPEGEVLTFDNYQAVGGPQYEIYLKGQNALASDNGLKFKVPVKTNGRVMVSLRAVTDPTTATINGHKLEIKSKTEMYYDITDYVEIANGYASINIVNTGNSMLSVNNIKTTRPN